MHGVLAQEGGPLDVVFKPSDTTALWVILGISLVALVFAYYLVRAVLAAPEGTERMKEIAKAIQEGASAYLSRQFRTLSIFVVIIGVALFFILPVSEDAVHSGFSIRFGRSIAFILGAGFSAVTGYVGHVAGGPCQRPHRQRRPRIRVARGREDRVPRRRRGRHVHGGSGPVRRHRDLDPLQGRRHRRAGGVRVRRRAAGHVHAGRRRDLHQGRRRGRRPGGQGRAGHPRGRPAQRGDHRRQRGRQRGRLRRHGRGPVRVQRGHA